MPPRAPLPDKHPQTPPINRQLQHNPRPKRRNLLPLIRPPPRQSPKHRQTQQNTPRSPHRHAPPLPSRIREPHRHGNKRQIESEPRQESHALERRARRGESVEDFIGHGRAHVFDWAGEVAVADRARDVEEVAEEVEGAAGDYEEVLDEEVGFGWVEKGVGGLDYEVGVREGVGEVEGHDRGVVL